MSEWQVDISLWLLPSIHLGMLGALLVLLFPRLKGHARFWVPISAVACMGATAAVLTATLTDPRILYFYPLSFLLPRVAAATLCSFVGLGAIGLFSRWLKERRLSSTD